MGLKIICHDCENILYNGIDLIHFFKLRAELDGKCPKCDRKLSVRPVNVKLEGIIIGKNC
jgi:hypothetical protein